MNKKWYIKIWTMRKYLDLWSVNHTLAGSILASLFIFFNAPFLASMAISFFILLGWEFFEITHKLHETIYNRIFDMIVGMSGFFLTNTLVNNDVFTNKAIFSVVFTVFVILEIWGFSVFEKIKNSK